MIYLYTPYHFLNNITKSFISDLLLPYAIKKVKMFQNKKKSVKSLSWLVNWLTILMNLLENESFIEHALWCIFFSKFFSFSRPFFFYGTASNILQKCYAFFQLPTVVVTGSASSAFSLSSELYNKTWSGPVGYSERVTPFRINLKAESSSI